MVIFGERMKVIYMKRFRKLRQWIRYGKPSIYGYTIDQDVYMPVTEEDFESVTVLIRPQLTGFVAVGTDLSRTARLPATDK